MLYFVSRLYVSSITSRYKLFLSVIDNFFRVLNKTQDKRLKK